MLAHATDPTWTTRNVVGRGVQGGVGPRGEAERGAPGEGAPRAHDPTQSMYHQESGRDKRAKPIDYAPKEVFGLSISTLRKEVRDTVVQVWAGQRMGFLMTAPLHLFPKSLNYSASLAWIRALLVRVS